MEDQTPKLTKLKEFEQVLADYKISPRGVSVLEESKFVVMCGVAGGGRNTVINELVKTGKYKFVVSDTTRQPKFRDGKMEVHGVNYFFRTEEEFLEELRQGLFIEAEIIHHQQVSGTSIREIHNAHQKGLIGVHDFDIGGTNNIAKASDKVIIIALLPPSFDEWQRRLKSREDMPEQEFKNRMSTAVRILQDFCDKPFYRFVVNDVLAQAAEDVRKIVEFDDYSNQKHDEYLALAKDLLQKTQGLLQ
jgi:guanylate kinase